MSESAARITLSAKGLIMKIVGDVLIIETSDPDELRREVNRALGDEPLTVQGAAGHLIKPGSRIAESGTLCRGVYRGNLLQQMLQFRPNVRYKAASAAMDKNTPSRVKLSLG